MTQTTVTSPPNATDRTTQPHTTSLDPTDPRVEAARDAEQRAYDHYGVTPTEHYVDVPDLALTIRVNEVGTGPPMVLITGGNGPGIEWLPLLPHLPDRTLYVLDRPGAGFSDGIDHRSVPFERQAISTTLAVFDHFDLDGAPIVANSIGGWWAIRFAQAHPDRLSVLALLGCPAFYPGTSAPLSLRLGSLPVVGGVLFERVIQADDAAGSRENWAFLGQADETVSGLPEAFAQAWYRIQNLPTAKLAWVSMLQTVARLRGANPAVALTSADLGAVDVPVVLLWGRNDTFGSIEKGRAAVGHFPDAELHEVGEGHLPWLDAPRECGEMIRGSFEW